MTLTEFLAFVGPLGLLLALYGTIRTEILRRGTNIEETRREFQQLKNDVDILKVRLEPLFTVMAARIGALFHEADDHWRLDRLIEKYQADPESLSDTELDRLIRGVYGVYQRVQRGGPEDNPTQAIAATLYLALLDGQRSARRVQRDDSSHASTGHVPWWRRWWTILRQR